MRCSSCRATGSAAQPASWPCVIAMALVMLLPRRSAGVIKPSGAAAPKTTVSASTRLAISMARRVTPGVGIISDVGCRTTSNGWRASNPAAPSHRGA